VARQLAMHASRSGVNRLARLEAESVAATVIDAVGINYAAAPRMFRR
jgi:hypothetical protein